MLKPAKWPLRACSGALSWGECQGSGANPYRVVADTEDGGSKCTCPSRKFPCKHALGLMWMFVEDSAAFPSGDVPDWVSDLMGRRRGMFVCRGRSGFARVCIVALALIIVSVGVASVYAAIRGEPWVYVSQHTGQYINLLGGMFLLGTIVGAIWALPSNNRRASNRG